MSFNNGDLFPDKGFYNDGYNGNEVLGSDDFEGNTNNSDPYRYEETLLILKTVDKTSLVLDKKPKFKSVEINGTTIEYLVLDEFYTHGEILDLARENNARLPSEDEFRELIRFCGVEKFTNDFPGHQYPNRIMVGGSGKFIQYWLDSESTGGTVNAIMIINGHLPKINTTSIPKNCGICACLIKK